RGFAVIAPVQCKPTRFRVVQKHQFLNHVSVNQELFTNEAVQKQMFLNQSKNALACIARVQLRQGDGLLRNSNSSKAKRAQVSVRNPPPIYKKSATLKAFRTASNRRS